ncbi:MAG: DUF1848 domain-containing protein, partial [Desulfomonile sp.]|nr:DUF1848 domain-containing protein [Desulfomonile sp.]
FSFCDYYRKTIRNMERLVPDYARPTEAECRELAEELAEIAARSGIKLLSCSHEFLVSSRIDSARCIDPEFLFRVVDSVERKHALSTLKTAPTRKECRCVASRDIGAYETCGHGCVYCYANAEPERAANNLMLIRPDSPTLDPSGGAAITAAGNDARLSGRGGHQGATVVHAEAGTQERRLDSCFRRDDRDSLSEWGKSSGKWDRGPR